MTKPLKLDPKVVYRLISDDGTFATVLHIICMVAYGEEIYQVDPLELLIRLEEDFGVRVTDDNENKLKAILIGTSTDIFYEEPEGFRSICETLTNGDPGIEVMDTLTISEVAWALYEIELSHGPGEFRPEVLRIIEQVISSEAIDPEDGTDVDPYEYIWAYIKEVHQTLTGQLIELGIPPSDIPSPETPAILTPGQLDVDQVQ